MSHFFYEWSNENPFVGLFSPANESVWEHLKLVFFPVLLYTIFEAVVLGKNDRHFLTSRLAGLMAGLLLIPTLFFIYTGFLGRTLLLFDLSIYLLSVLTTFFLSYYLEIHLPSLELSLPVLLFILVFLLLVFFFFTFRPPRLPLFEDWSRQQIQSLLEIYKIGSS